MNQPRPRSLEDCAAWLRESCGDRSEIAAGLTLAQMAEDNSAGEQANFVRAIIGSSKDITSAAAAHMLLDMKRRIGSAQEISNSE